MSEVAWWAGNSAGANVVTTWADARNHGLESHPVGLKPENAFGLHDMHGNVFEWVLDGYDPNFYSKTDGATDPLNGPAGNGIYRGGSYFNNQSCFCPNENFLRSAARSANNPCGPHGQELGFRAAFWPLP